MAAARNLVYFDIETQLSKDEVGGWHRARDMKMSVGVTFSTARGGYRIYPEREVPELLRELRAADLVVGYNIAGFDYEVLRGYDEFFDPEQLRTLDLCAEMNRKLGHRLGLDAIASGTFGLGKTSDGMQALRWWKEGRVREIAEYCCYDVKLTKLVHEYGLARRQLHYLDKLGNRRSVAVEW